MAAAEPQRRRDVQEYELTRPSAHLLCVFASLRQIFACILILLVPQGLPCQTDTTKHGWPVTPFFSTHPITGVFCEFRNTLTADHFHNGTDIPKPDGSPVYPVYDGTVISIGTTQSEGDDAYVRVRYNVSGLVKSDAYVHINPNPLLAIGDSVHAYQTVLGNILPGLGHTHFTNGLVGSEMNGIRPNGGLTPYIDNYPPHIVSVRFFVDGTEIEFLNHHVSSAVDIRVQIAETSAADASGLSSSTTNNGTYIAGYTIMSPDTATIVYQPPSSGVRYKFDSKPTDADVHVAFATGSDVSTHIYTLTNGAGADAVNATHRVSNNSWNTLALPTGDYLVKVFAEDTRGLSEVVYIPVTVDRGDLVPPATPTLKAVLNDSTNRITVSWYPNTDADLRGYRLYYTLNGVTWFQKESEATLGPGKTSVVYNNVLSGTIFFRLAAVDSASPVNVSGFSDVYGVKLNTSSAKTLIVDGFDRTEPSGSYHEPSHPFAMTQGFSVPGDFSTCANDAVIDGSVSLLNYQVVVWVLGDESSDDETFNTTEQSLVAEYLKNGGKLFVSGSEIAYDLDRPSGPTQADRDFLHQYLKVSFAGDDANEYTVVGSPSSVFQNLTFRYGIVSEGAPYEEDWPDYVNPVNGGSVILHYANASSTVYAGSAFSGTFPNGTQPGAVVLVGFPFETITTKANRDSLMRRVYDYFGVTTGVGNGVAALAAPTEFTLQQNFPNPFNPTTEIRYTIPVGTYGRTSLHVYDMLGRDVATLVNELKEPGTYTATWDAANVASGIYFYRLDTGNYHKVLKMMVLK